MVEVSPEREWLLRIRRPWRVADNRTPAGFWYIFDDEERQIGRYAAKVMALHIVELHNTWLDQQ